MKFLVPGFPTEISDYIEAPTIAELIRYPMFFNAAPEAVYKYGTEWQKKLLDAVPLRNDKRYVTVRMEVHIQAPGYRAATSTTGRINGKVGPGWHIDGEYPFDYLHADERVHLYQTNCRTLTEFNVHPFEIEMPKPLTNEELSSYICKNLDKLPIVGKQAPPNRIITFHNELHRNLTPKYLEFRFIMRVRETNKLEPPHKDEKAIRRANKVFCLFNQNMVDQIQQDNNKIIIHLPDVKTGAEYEPEFV